MFKFLPLNLASAVPSPAYAAALALVIIQVGIGIVFKAAQNGGTYTFSTTGSIFISETLKGLLSTIFFYRECRKRQETSSGNYGALASQSPPQTSLEDGSSDWSGSQDGEDLENEKSLPYSDRARIIPFQEFVTIFKNEMPADNVYGFTQLALLYSLINNSVFIAYKLADSGTISLLRSGITLITALVLFFSQGIKIVEIQWIAIVVQICGLVVTQYQPDTGSSYPFTTYLLIIIQTTISACSGVYNQQLLKRHNVSLHANNMVLYAAGASLNLVFHIIISLLKSDEPGLFSGYNSFGAIMVVLSNVFIGLAITAVYKYADAVVKCFATAVSTGVLLYLSPILFGTTMSFLVLPGTVVVFIATYLYMVAAPPKPANTAPPLKEVSSESVLPSWGFANDESGRRFKRFGFLIFTVTVTTFTVVALSLAKATMPDHVLTSSAKGFDTDQAKNSSTVVESPFKNTLGFVRFNAHLPERVPLIKHYGPFFHSLHLSLPPGDSPSDVDFAVNQTYDTYPAANYGPDTYYITLADTMSQILDTKSKDNITGIFLFHFDVWVDPMAFGSEDLNNAWFMASGAPEFHCGKSRDEPQMDGGWNWWENGGEHRAKGAVQAIVRSDFGLPSQDAVFCRGWSDLLYVPRRFFEDFIFLATIFKAHEVYHEIAFPTIMHMLDQTRRSSPSKPALSLIADCWGNCCASDPPSKYDIYSRRCGHHLDYRDEDQWRPHYERLEKESKELGTLSTPAIGMARMNRTRVIDE